MIRENLSFHVFLINTVHVQPQFTLLPFFRTSMRNTVVERNISLQSILAF